MLETLIPVGFVVLLWWLSTGAILWLARGVGSQLYPRLMVITAMCGLAFAGVIIASAHSEVWSVYLAFASALTIWGWIEFTFLAGMITGSENKTCPENISEGKRFVMAFRTICHHEYALAIVLVILAVLDTNQGSGMAIKTFALLWLMRLGAKLSIFSGAPSISVEMLPERLSHIKSYFRQDRVSSAFWISFTGCAVFLIAGVYALVAVDYSPLARVEITILTTLVGLALVEYAFLVLPFKDSKLWHWAMDKKTPKDITGGVPQEKTGSL